CAMTTCAPVCLSVCFSLLVLCLFSSFFFNDTATTEIYSLSLHDALPIYPRRGRHECRSALREIVGAPTVYALTAGTRGCERRDRDRKSTRLNSSLTNLVCRLLLEKKKKTTTPTAPVRSPDNDVTNGAHLT